MTGRPSEVLGLNRGSLEKGMPADINIFHLDRLDVHADFENPAEFCTGFDYVMVNGQITVDHDHWKNTGSGEILLRM